MTAVGASSLAATLVNPYGVRIYDPLLRYLRQAPVIYQHIHELRPQSVESICFWMTLAIALLGTLTAALLAAAGQPVLRRVGHAEREQGRTDLAPA